MGQVVPLQNLQSGEKGEIVDVFGDDRLVARLAENGLRKGGRLEVLAAGNPFLCRVDETRLSLRTNGQVEVFVSLLPAH